MDKFFTQSYCDRCGNTLEKGRIMSRFTTKCICMICSKEEKQDKDYNKAIEVEHEEIKKGNYGYKGIRG